MKRETVMMLVILAVSATILDYFNGFQIAALIGRFTSQFVSDSFLLGLFVILLVAACCLYFYLQKLDADILKQTCTPKMTPSEFDYKMKRTTLEKIEQLKNSPDYNSVMEEARSRQASASKRSSSRSRFTEEYRPERDSRYYVERESRTSYSNNVFYE